MARSPSSNSFFIIDASKARSRLSLTVLMGDMISERQETELVMARIGRPRAVGRKMGSIRVLCEQMKRTPDWLADFLTGRGRVPLTMTRTPSALKA